VPIDRSRWPASETHHTTRLPRCKQVGLSRQTKRAAIPRERAASIIADQRHVAFLGQRRRECPASAVHAAVVGRHAQNVGEQRQPKRTSDQYAARSRRARAVKPDSKAAIEALKSLGIEVVVRPNTEPAISPVPRGLLK
jgi:hypothetical protein